MSANIYPNSSLITSVYVPDFFDPTLVSTSDGSLVLNTDFTIEQDTSGSSSIIRLNKVPFIDLAMYDTQRRNWFYTDRFGGKWRFYRPGSYMIETETYLDANTRYPAAYSMDGFYNGEQKSVNDLSSFNISEYLPIRVKVNNYSLADITDYSGGQNVVGKLDNIDPTNNKEFYYDFKNTIYTNQDLSLYEAEDILIEFYINIDSINISCRMNTNITNLSEYTPSVDYYVVKLTGQNL